MGTREKSSSVLGRAGKVGSLCILLMPLFHLLAMNHYLVSWKFGSIQRMSIASLPFFLTPRPCSAPSLLPLLFTTLGACSQANPNIVLKLYMYKPKAKNVCVITRILKQSRTHFTGGDFVFQ